MKVILLKDVKSLGRIGEVREVSDGYARNFLLARKLAKVATPSTAAEFEHQQKSKAEQMTREAKILETKLSQITLNPVKFALKADDKGHLYAGLKESEILSKLSQGAAPHLKLINYTPIKELGVHEISAQIRGAGSEKRVKFRVIVEKAKT